MPVRSATRRAPLTLTGSRQPYWTIDEPDPVTRGEILVGALLAQIYREVGGNLELTMQLAKGIAIGANSIVLLEMNRRSASVANRVLMLILHFPVHRYPPIGRDEVAARHTGINLGATRRAYALNW